jgi:tRNA pseudouridine55 synthase
MGRRRHNADGPNGLLLVDKPAGLSSAAVVARVRRLFGGVKAGHTGTLDPFATGLLPLCLGEGTKLATYLTDADKSYEGTIRLGVVTDTLDRTGTVTATSPVPEFGDARLEEIAQRFRGDIEQVPPSYSAIKRGGTPMYELARRGEAPELEPRAVRVDRLVLAKAGEDCLSVSIDCSKGFYVRSLAHDVGAALGCGAVLDELRRTRVGDLLLEAATPLEALEQAADPAALVVPLEDALGHLRLVDLAASEAESLRLGRQAPLLRIPPGAEGEKVRIVAAGALVAVATFRGRLWELDRVFAKPVSGRLASSCPPTGFVLPPAVSHLEEEERNEANRRD